MRPGRRAECDPRTRETPCGRALHRPILCVQNEYRCTAIKENTEEFGFVGRSRWHLPGEFGRETCLIRLSFNSFLPVS